MMIMKIIMDNKKKVLHRGLQCLSNRDYREKKHYVLPSISFLEKKEFKCNKNQADATLRSRGISHVLASG